MGYKAGYRLSPCQVCYRCWAQVLNFLCANTTPHSVHQPNTLQDLVQLTVRNIRLVGTPKRNPFVSMFKRRAGTVTATAEGAASVENQVTFPASDGVDNQQAESLDLSDSAQVALEIAQRVSLPNKISAAIR